MRHARKVHRRGAHPGLCRKVVKKGQISREASVWLQVPLPFGKCFLLRQGPRAVSCGIPLPVFLN